MMVVSFLMFPISLSLVNPDGEAELPQSVHLEDFPAPFGTLMEHDPDRLPGGSAVPRGCQWEGHRLVRAQGNVLALAKNASKSARGEEKTGHGGQEGRRGGICSCDLSRSRSRSTKEEVSSETNVFPDVVFFISSAPLLGTRPTFAFGVWLMLLTIPSTCGLFTFFPRIVLPQDD